MRSWYAIPRAYVLDRTLMNVHIASTGGDPEPWWHLPRWRR